MMTSGRAQGRLSNAEPMLGSFTVADLWRWPDDVRVELHDGVPLVMEAPQTLHQLIATNLTRTCGNFLAKKPCQVIAGLGVSLPKGNQTYDSSKTLVIPDLVVICDRRQLNEKGCLGAPDLAIEILSKSTRSHDQVRKLNLYEKHGVREYWVIDPAGIALVFALRESDGERDAECRYGRPETYDMEMTIRSQIFPELAIPMVDIFPTDLSSEPVIDVEPKSPVTSSDKTVRESPKQFAGASSVEGKSAKPQAARKTKAKK